MMHIAIILSFILSTQSGIENHEYHASITNIEYISEKQEIQITSRLFIDDLEKMLHKRLSENITINSEQDESAIDGYIEKYLKNKLVIRIHKEAREITYLGKEVEDESVILYSKISNVSFFNEIDITNKMLFDTFDDQQNIIKIKKASGSKSFVLIPGNNSHFFKLN